MERAGSVEQAGSPKGSTEASQNRDMAEQSYPLLI